MEKEQLHVIVSPPGPETRSSVPGGVPLVFTHGYGGSTETWQHQLQAFSQTHSTVAWDLLGHGRSAKSEQPEDYSRELALDWLAAMMTRAGDAPVLIGHSLGGYLSQCYAVRNPEQVRALVLIATGPGYRDPEARERWNKGVRRVSKRFGLPPASTPLVEQHDSLVMDHLDRLTMPVLQIAGSEDVAYHGGMKYLERRLIAVDSFIVPGGGHHVHETHSSEVNDAIRVFLDALS